MALKSTEATWFRPLWRRIAVTAFLAVWLAWELIWTQDSFWALLVGAALAYSLYNFFYAFPKEEPAAAADPQEETPPRTSEERPD